MPGLGPYAPLRWSAVSSCIRYSIELTSRALATLAATMLLVHLHSSFSFISKWFNTNLFNQFSVMVIGHSHFLPSKVHFSLAEMNVSLSFLEYVIVLDAPFGHLIVNTSLSNSS